MHSYTDLMNRMRVGVYSPDGRIYAELHDGTAVRFEFDGDSYYDYRHPALEYQLASLARLLWAGRIRGEREALSQILGYEVGGSGVGWSTKKQRWREELDALSMEGVSVHEWVCIRCTGWRDWRVILVEGALEELDEEFFISELQSAIKDLVADNREMLDLLRTKLSAETLRNGKPWWQTT